MIVTTKLHEWALEMFRSTCETKAPWDWAINEIRELDNKLMAEIPGSLAELSQGCDSENLTIMISPVKNFGKLRWGDIARPKGEVTLRCDGVTGD